MELYLDARKQNQPDTFAPPNHVMATPSGRLRCWGIVIVQTICATYFSQT